MIFITGAARSGTSLTAGVLEASGLYLNEVNLNKEYVPIRDYLLKPYLAGIGADPMGQDPLPNQEMVWLDGKWRRKVLDVLDHPGEPWGYKDAKIAITWRLWANAFPEAKWVLVRRPINKIAESCVRTQFMIRRSSHEEWRNWAEYYVNRLEEIKQSENYCEVWPGPDPESFREIIEFCGLKFDRDAIRRTFKPSRWHG